MENTVVNNTQDTAVADEKQQRLKRRLQNKLTAIRNHFDAVVIFYDKVGLSTEVVRANKILRNLKKRIITWKITPEEILNTESKYEEISRYLWKNLQDVMPTLVGFDPKNWRQLNDDFQTKTMLVQRINTLVVIPKSEVVGQLAMGVKQLHKASLKYSEESTEGDLIMLQKIGQIYRETAEKLKTLNDSVMEKYSIVLSPVRRNTPSVQNTSNDGGSEQSSE